MISLILIAIAASLNAMMDITAHKFYRSVFNQIKNPEIKAWFRTPDSWKLKYEWDGADIIRRKRIKIPKYKIVWKKNGKK